MKSKHQFDYRKQAERVVLHVMAESARMQLALAEGRKEGADAIYQQCVKSVECRLREMRDEI